MINENNKLEKAQLVIELLNKCLDKQYLDVLNSKLDHEYVSYYDYDEEHYKCLESLNVILGYEDTILDVMVCTSGISVYAVCVKNNKDIKQVFKFNLDKEEWTNCENVIEKFKEMVEYE